MNVLMIVLAVIGAIGILCLAGLWLFVWMIVNKGE